jgi:hypothetical protein
VINGFLLDLQHGNIIEIRNAMDFYEE